MEGFKKIVDKPDLEVVLEDECPIQRAEEEVEITSVLKRLAK